MRPDLQAVFVLGLVYTGLALLFELALPILWPRKDHTKAKRLLSFVWWIGICAISAGVLVALLEFAETKG